MCEGGGAAGSGAASRGRLFEAAKLLDRSVLPAGEGGGFVHPTPEVGLQERPVPPRNVNRCRVSSRSFMLGNNAFT